MEGERLQTKRIGAGDTERVTAPPIVRDVLQSSGQPLDSATRAFMEPRFGRDFSDVRVHTDQKAAESAQAVNARAYTIGPDIVFGPGQYAPETGRGRQLVAHELTHVVQQRPGLHQANDGLRLSDTGEAAEKEATAAAHAVTRGETYLGTLHTPVTVARDTPDNSGTAFAGEDPALRSRRLDVLTAARTAIQRLRNALSRGYLWPFETVTAGGVTPAHVGDEETLASREARLRQLVTDLIQVISRLETAPIPPAWLAPEVQEPGAAFLVPGTGVWRDTVMFYGHYVVGRGENTDFVYENAPYIETDPIASRTVRRAPISRGVPLGINLIVPDPENEPLVYRRLTGYEGWQSQGVILEVWQDDFGYFYLYKGEKHYLPRRP